jgi:general secretion pathway protein C
MTQTISMSGKTSAGKAMPRPARLVIALAELALLTALAHVAARMIWLIAFGASATDFRHDPAGGRAGMSRPAYVADLTRLREADLFADRRTGTAAAAPAPVAVQETRLDLTLRGIRRGATPDSGGAIIQTPDNRQRFFAAGHTILDGVTLEEVHVDHVLIDRRGVTESLYLRDDEGGASRATSRRTMTVPAGAQAVEGLFRAEPVREGNTLTGYRVVSGNAAMLSATGVRNGDVITAVDGRPVADISDLSAEFRRLRGRDAFALSLNRGGLPLTVQVDLP